MTGDQVLIFNGIRRAKVLTEVDAELLPTRTEAVRRECAEGHTWRGSLLSENTYCTRCGYYRVELQAWDLLVR